MIALAVNRIAPARPNFTLTPALRALVLVVSIALGAASLAALSRWASGVAPYHSNIRNLAVVIHLSAVLPAVPLGAWLLLARKGTPRHKLLGRVWIAMMLVTALSAIFIRTSGSFSWIHVFVPITLYASVQTVRHARAGRIAEHRRQIISLYLGALAIPGLFAFSPDRLMGYWLYG